MKERPTKSASLQPNSVFQAGFTATMVASKRATSMTSVESRHIRSQSRVRSSTCCSRFSLRRSNWAAACLRSSMSVFVPIQRTTAPLGPWIGSARTRNQRKAPSARRMRNSVS